MNWLGSSQNWWIWETKVESACEMESYQGKVTWN